MQARQYPSSRGLGYGWCTRLDALLWPTWLPKWLPCQTLSLSCTGGCPPAMQTASEGAPPLAGFRSAAQTSAASCGMQTTSCVRGGLPLAHGTPSHGITTPTDGRSCSGAPGIWRWAVQDSALCVPQQQSMILALLSSMDAAEVCEGVEGYGYLSEPWSCPHVPG